MNTITFEKVSLSNGHLKHFTRTTKLDKGTQQFYTLTLYLNIKCDILEDSYKNEKITVKTKTEATDFQILRSLNFKFSSSSKLNQI